MDANSMIIRELQEEHIDGIIKLWNSSISAEFPYKPITPNGFINNFIKNPNFNSKGNFVMLISGEIVGFISSAFSRSVSNEIYLTMLLVRYDVRKKGYGSILLNHLEESIRSEGKNKIKMDFFNPINLSWNIPDTKLHDHPNAPGVDIDSEAYSFFIKHGYTERTKEVSMYMPLCDFILINSIKDKIISLKNKGIEITFYDKEKLYDFSYLYNGLNNNIWKMNLEYNLSLEKPYPLIIAAKDRKICGFAGPLQIEGSGRGRFTGIGVHPDFQGMGIGKVLFFMLCNNFKNIGAEFISLFTGINNNARKMYKDAGLKEKKTWALLIKEI